MATKTASCTPDELESLCRAGARFLFEPSCDVNEVYERVFVGGEEIARDLSKLATLGITHVLNCAEGPSRMFRVDTNQEYYVDASIKYCGLPVSDDPRANLKQHFETAAKFIDETLSQKDAKVLIHCVVGFSRSATVAIAYLMIRRGMTAQEATQAVRKNREIGPNDGFLVQLCELNSELHPN
eukprot:XP_011664342.1 PREDICTED: dual specificity protein phosphatase 3 [Strongylocentrotus purpuratus]